MNNWIPLFVLPNTTLREVIAGEFFELVPLSDPRIIELSNAHQNFKIFLTKFTDAFGVELQPSIIIARSDAPNAILNVDAIASFRDLIAVSVIPLERAREIRYPRGDRILYSNYFSLYPWTLDKNYEHLITNTIAMLALHNVKEFRGQGDPLIHSKILSLGELDEPLLTSLLSRWSDCYAKPNPSWRDRALFRSLNMANAAMLLPAGSDTTVYDIGRMFGLWISAFEILAHPGTGKSGFVQVFDLLENVEWEYKKSRHRRYRAHEKDREKRRRNLSCWLYGQLYSARNDFIHGNPVEVSRLHIKGSNRSLFQFAAPIYRLALTGFLPLNWSTPMPSATDTEEFAQYISDRISFVSPQKTIEETALHLARIPAEPDDED